MQKEKTYDERKQEVEELSQLINEITASGGVLSIGYYELMTILPMSYGNWSMSKGTLL